MSLSVSNSFIQNLPTFDTSGKPALRKKEPTGEDVQQTDFASVQKSIEPQQQDVVTGEEKQFFATMFPEKSDAIQSYSVYGRSGVKSAVSLGTIIDAKG